MEAMTEVETGPTGKVLDLVVVMIEGLTNEPLDGFTVGSVAEFLGQLKILSYAHG